MKVAKTDKRMSLLCRGIIYNSKKSFIIQVQVIKELLRNGDIALFDIEKPMPG
jgi:hypothetical protein